MARSVCAIDELMYLGTDLDFVPLVIGGNIHTCATSTSRCKRWPSPFYSASCHIALWLQGVVQFR